MWCGRISGFPSGLGGLQTNGKGSRQGLADHVHRLAKRPALILGLLSNLALELVGLSRWGEVLAVPGFQTSVWRLGQRGQRSVAIGVEIFQGHGLLGAGRPPNAKRQSGGLVQPLPSPGHRS